MSLGKTLPESLLGRWAAVRDTALKNRQRLADAATRTQGKAAKTPGSKTKASGQSMMKASGGSTSSRKASGTLLASGGSKLGTIVRSALLDEWPLYHAAQS